MLYQGHFHNKGETNKKMIKTYAVTVKYQSNCSPKQYAEAPCVKQTS